MTNNKEIVVSGFRNELSESLKRHGKQVINECLIVVNMLFLMHKMQLK